MKVGSFYNSYYDKNERMRRRDENYCKDQDGVCEK